jgi:hypothetical protein
MQSAQPSGIDAHPNASSKSNLIKEVAERCVQSSMAQRQTPERKMSMTASKRPRLRRSPPAQNNQAAEQQSQTTGRSSVVISGNFGPSAGSRGEKHAAAHCADDQKADVAFFKHNAIFSVWPSACIRPGSC